MTEKEEALFDKFTNGMDTYLEWGTGGSSAHLATKAQSHAFAIDSYQEWCTKVLEDPCVKEAGEKFQLFCVNHPNTTIHDWGAPKPSGKVDDLEEFYRGNKSKNRKSSEQHLVPLKECAFRFVLILR